MDIARLAVVASSNGTKELRQELRGVADDGRKAEEATKRFSAANDDSVARSRRAADAAGDLARSLGTGNGAGVAGSLARLLPFLGPVGAAIGTMAAAAGGAAIAIERYNRTVNDLNSLAAGVGRSVGLTGDALGALAERAAAAGNITVGAAREMEAAYIRAGVTNAGVLEKLIGLTDDYAAAAGVDAAAAVKDLAAGFDGTAKGAEGLDDKINLLDDTTRQHVRTLAEQNDRTAVQIALLPELADAVQGAADKVTGLQAAWRDARNAAADFFDLVGKQLAVSTGGGSAQDRLDALESGSVPAYGAAGVQIQTDEKARLRATIAQADASAKLTKALEDQKKLSKDAGEVIRDALPKEQALAEIRNKRVLIEKAIAAGATDVATATRALNALDKEAAELGKEKAKRPAAISAEARAYKQATDAAKDYIASLKQQIAEVGKTPAEIAAMRAALEAAKAPTDALREEAARLGLELVQLSERQRLLDETADPAAKAQETLTEKLAFLRAEAEAGRIAFDEYFTAKSRALNEALPSGTNGSYVEGQFVGNVTMPKGVDLGGELLGSAASIDTSGIKSLTDRLQEAADAVAEVRNNFEDVLGALKNNDWAAAASGLIRAIKSIQDAQKVTSPSGQQAGWIGAASATASAAGSLIGGTAGSAISGAGSGALTGFTVAGPVGAAVGAVVGGILGLFSGSSAKKAERQAQIQQELEDAAATARKSSNEQASLAATIAGLQGRAEESLAATRKLALAELEPENQALQELAWALEDALDKRELEIELMSALGDASGALAATRQLELDQTLESQRALKQAIWDLTDAQDALTAANDNVADWKAKALDAYQEESAALQETIDKFKAFADSLKAFRQQLTTGTAAGLSPEAQYAATQSEFQRVSAEARLGSPEALEDLQQVSEDYLNASREYYGSSEAYFADLEAVRSSVEAAEGVASRQVGVAEQQLSEMTKTVEALGIINGSVLSLGESITGLAGAMAEQAAATSALASAQADANAVLAASVASSSTASTGTTPDYTAYVNSYADLAAEYAKIGAGPELAAMGITSLATYGKWHWENFGQAEGRTLPKYASGGLASGWSMVGERGQEAVDFKTPGRVYSAEQTRGMFAGGGDNRALEAKLDRVIAQNDAILRQRAEIWADEKAQRGEATRVARGVKSEIRRQASA